ncbi:alpha/beta fold hydrolase [Actinacidiphila acididurans]|uniref:Alpha/beta fold hydrolase n=1 Tax=Actinacidiphila acididurans TaxID=2784346 RepID=A0ABS2TLP2_9ACTN|nr:alpha/beta fold hydrolase [Actinacidiphila acididurans]MBM9504254.1 alpha/beta fold hydrolase [Actinacidiphila acididurans]
MNRHSKTTGSGQVSIETYLDGENNDLDVVILPSYGRDGGEDFDVFTAALVAAGYRVLRPQPRGTAGSTGPMSGVTIGDLGDDVAGVIDRLGHGPAVVLGHAYGNFVARTVATDHPGTVRAVVLAAASTRAVPPEIDNAPFRAGDLTLSDEERLAALRLAFFAPGHDASVWLSGWYPRTLAMQRAAVTGIDIGRYWGAGQAPILEILADSDPFHPRSQWDDLRTQFGERVTSAVVEDAGHALFPEQPAAVADAAITYLRAMTRPNRRTTT